MTNQFEKISVICSLYIGNRPVQVNEMHDNKLYYFNKQLEYLKRYKHRIYKFYFVTTFEDQYHSQTYKPKLLDFQNEQVNFIFKENLGGSYTSWKEGLKFDNGESDLIFLIEDDYVIYQEKSIDIIISDFNDEPDLFYYCSSWSDILITVQGTRITSHANISNGIINNRLYYNSSDEFQVVNKIERQSLFLNQILFLEPFRIKGYKIKDYKNKYSSMFSHGVNQIEEFGIPNGEIIIYPLTKTAE